MPGDYSRFTFDPQKLFSQLLHQQGRVQLDSDWNELMEMIAHRLRTQAEDTFGAAAVSKLSTPDAFSLSFDATNDLVIAPGRMYVGGLAAEVFSPGPVTYKSQPFSPFGPSEPFIPVTGKYLAYLDVWEREVTAVEDPTLLEPALEGVDTGARKQRVWQLRLADAAQLGNTEPGCAVDLDAKFPPSGARLSSQANQPAAASDPCTLPDVAGYRGLENRLYRVEIHKGGTAQEATFKWSVDNASIATVAEAISGNKVTVHRIGRDEVMRFQPNDWVELIDDAHELAGLPGELFQVDVVHDEERVLELVTQPTNFEAGKTRVRRWDQSAGVNGSGAIPVASGANWFALDRTGEKSGVEIKLGLTASGEYHTGDYWVFAARNATATVEELTEAPPRGIEHHRAHVAVIDFAQKKVTDCRVLWPPLDEEAGCGCTICVTPLSHTGKDPKNPWSIQSAVDEVIKRGGGKVCLAPGSYRLKDTLSIRGRGVTIAGVPGSTWLGHEGKGPAVQMLNAEVVTLQGLGIFEWEAEGKEPVVVAIANSAMVKIHDCLLWVVAPKTAAGLAKSEIFSLDRRAPILPKQQEASPSPVDGAAVLLGGIVEDVEIARCLLAAGDGITTGDEATPEMKKWSTCRVAARLSLVDNWILASSMCVHLRGRVKSELPSDRVLVLSDLHIRRNHLHADDVAIALSGISDPAHPVRIEHNQARAGRGGILVEASAVLIEDNLITSAAPAKVTAAAKLSTRAIGIGGSAFPTLEIEAVVARNRAQGAWSIGIDLLARFLSASIVNNLLHGISEAGIRMPKTALGRRVLVSKNTIRRAAGDADSFDGIALTNAASADVSENRIEETSFGSSRAIVLDWCGVTAVRANVVDVPPPSTELVPRGGIWVKSPLGALDIGNNIISSDGPALDISAQPPDAEDATRKVWIADGALHFASLASGVVKLGPGQLAISVGSNTLRSWRGRTMVRIHVGGPFSSCVFQANQLRSEDDSSLEIHAGSIVLTSTTTRMGGGGVMLHVFTPPDAKAPPATVIGNIVDGGIWLNNQPLGAPWASLNLHI